MAGSRTWLPMLVILAALVLAYWIFQPSNDRASSNADLVYCLAPTHQAGLVKAAVSLGLVGAGSSPAAVRVARSVMPLSVWHARDDADFTTACDAYAAPAFTSSGSSAADGGFGGLLMVLLPLAVGALLTLAVDEIKQGSDRRWERTEALRDSWSAFRGVIETYLKERQNPPFDGVPAQGEIDALRRDLAARLRTVYAQHRGSPAIAELRTQLNTVLGVGIADDWAAGESDAMYEERKRRAADITGALDRYDSSLQEVVEKLERGIWPSRRL